MRPAGSAMPPGSRMGLATEVVGDRRDFWFQAGGAAEAAKGVSRSNGQSRRARGIRATLRNVGQVFNLPPQWQVFNLPPQWQVENLPHFPSDEVQPGRGI